MKQSQNRMHCVCCEIRATRKSSKVLIKRLREMGKNQKFWAQKQKELKQLNREYGL